MIKTNEQIPDKNNKYRTNTDIITINWARSHPI